MGVDELIKDVILQKDKLVKEFNDKMSKLDNKLEPLYNKKYGGLSKHDFEVLEKLEEVERATGFGKSVECERNGEIPSSIHSLYCVIPNGVTPCVVNVELVSDTEFKVFGYEDFEGHTFSVDQNSSFLYKKKDEEVYRLVFRISNYRKFWVEEDLFMMSIQNKEKFTYDELPYEGSWSYDYCAMTSARDEYVRGLHNKN